MKKYLDYVESKYGKNFTEILYEKEEARMWRTYPA